MKKYFFYQLKDLSLDYMLLFEMLSLIFIGFVCLYSIIAERESALPYPVFQKQIIWFCLGFIIFIIILLTPFQLFFRGAYIFYAISLVLLVVVLFTSSGNVHRWISFGIFQFQPSEISKVTTMLVLARYLSLTKEGHFNWRQLFIGFIYIILPVLFILEQPDVGTASVFFAILVIMMVWAGITIKSMLFLFIPFIALLSGFHILVSIGFLFALVVGLFIAKVRWWKGLCITTVCLFLGLIAPIIWSTFESYQQQRILIFFGIKSDPHGAAYQAIQSRIAIGSGTILGKGFMQGSQTQLRFLPEQHTDFIFSVFGEEFGFVGVMVVMTIFLLLFSRLLNTARTARNTFASMVVVGSLSILAFQFFVNISMIVGLVPVTGLPLPFFSYGGSSLLMTMVLMGLVMNVSSQRYKY